MCKFTPCTDFRGKTAYERKAGTTKHLSSGDVLQTQWCSLCGVLTALELISSKYLIETYSVGRAVGMHTFAEQIATFPHAVVAHCTGGSPRCFQAVGHSVLNFLDVRSHSLVTVSVASAALHFLFQLSLRWTVTLQRVPYCFQRDTAHCSAWPEPPPAQVVDH